MTGDSAHLASAKSAAATIDRLNCVDTFERCWPILPPAVTKALRSLLVEPSLSPTGSMDAACVALLAALQNAGRESLHALCVDGLLDDDTHPFMNCLSRGIEPDVSTRNLLKRDLQRLQSVAELPWWELVAAAGVDWVEAPETGSHRSNQRPVPSKTESAPWSSIAERSRLEARLGAHVVWADLSQELEAFWRRYGCGPRQGIAAYRLADVAGLPALRPIENFDAFPLEWLQLGSARIQLLDDNTRALLEGAGAVNTLIWGPRGCGKSTLIRALVGKYWQQGLRAIEIPAAAYEQLPSLFELVRDRTECFIAVLDNIALEPQDPAHRTLATLLDGGLERTPENLVFYATSNYKDLVDRHGERPGGPPAQQADAAVLARQLGATEPSLQAYDPQGLQRLDERRALDDRFALKVFIDLPTQSQYEQILIAYAERADLPDSRQELLADFRIW
ncbi:MAG: DUF815 domain-containing protein, partial [Gemmatimonadetes bacterium]|nr:DUF815 domain-containing protein [Gemmatimonadota bacterium]